MVTVRSYAKLEKVPALSLRHMRHFMVLAETLSFRQAADTLGITSSALSQSIAEAERLLGARLFDRQGRQVQLSPAGALALPLVTHLINGVHNTLADLAEVTREAAATVHIGLVPSMADQLMKSLELFRRKHPKIAFQFYDMPADEIVPAVESGEVDLGIGVAHAAVGYDLDTAFLTRDRVAALLRKDDPLAGRPVTWASIANREICHFVQGDVSALAGGSLTSKKVLLRARYQVRFTETLFALVRAGFCVGVIPENTALSLKSDELLVTPIDEPSVDRDLVVIRKRGFSRTEAVKACYGFLEEQAAHP